MISPITHFGAWEVYFHNPSPAIIIVIFPLTLWCSSYLPSYSCPVGRISWQCGMVLPQWNNSLLTIEFWYFIPYSINKIQYFHWIMHMLIRYWNIIALISFISTVILILAYPFLYFFPFIFKVMKVQRGAFRHVIAENIFRMDSRDLNGM